MEVSRLKAHLQHHIQARHEHRQLESVAQQLQQAYARLQEERFQLQQQQRLLLHLTDVFGHLRSKLQDEDEVFQLPSTGLEEHLLLQLAVGAAARQVPDADDAADATFSAGSSTDSNSSMSSDKPQSGLGPHEALVSATFTSRSDSMLQDTCISGSPPCRNIREQHMQQQGMAPSSDQAAMCSQGCATSMVTSIDPSVPQQEPSNSAAVAAGGVEGCSASSALLAHLVQPVCPDSDPFMLLRLSHDLPPHPAARTASLQELQQLMSSQVQQLRVYLAQLHRELQSSTLQYMSPAHAAPAEDSSPKPMAPASAGPVDTAAGADVAASPAAAAEPKQNPLQGIQDVQMETFVLVQSLVSLGRGRDYFELQLTNWDTGEKLDAPCMQRHRAALQEVQLSPAQLQRMAAGHTFFQGLLLPLVAERKRLHAHGLAATPSHEPGPAAAVAAAAAATAAAAAADAGGGAEHGGVAVSSSSSSGGVGPLGAAMLAQQASSVELGRGARLQAQRECLARMRLLMRKDLLLRGAMAVYMQGCLSWVQQAKLRICMSPFHVNMGIFCACLMEQVAQQQQGLSINPMITCPLTDTGEGGEPASDRGCQAGGGGGEGGEALSPRRHPDTCVTKG